MKGLIIYLFSLFIFISIYVIDDRGTESGAANLWSYDGTINPYRWSLIYPRCAGRQQSPVAIDTTNVRYDQTLRPFRFNGYVDIRNVRTSLQNNGHTVEVDLTGRPIAIRDGGLQGIYRVKQFHFHWGATNRRGSEHEINGYHYPMEMHIVHYSTRYGNYEAAQIQPDGLAVLAFFFQIGAHNTNFDTIITHLDEIRFRGDTIPLDSFPLASLLPRNLRAFYRYIGSLTTPPCYESVIWTIFKTPVEISQTQISQFRFLVNQNFPNQTNVKISDDYRPIQALNGRIILSSDSLDDFGRRGAPAVPQRSPTVSQTPRTRPGTRRRRPQAPPRDTLNVPRRLISTNNNRVVSLPRRSTLPSLRNRLVLSRNMLSRNFPLSRNRGSLSRFSRRNGLSSIPGTSALLSPRIVSVPRGIATEAALLLQRRRRLRALIRAIDNQLLLGT